MAFEISKIWRLGYFLALFVYAASTTASHADFEQSKGWFGALGDEDRIALQTDLTLAGFYDALVDGTFGPSTYRALTAFQKWNGDPETGVLTEAALRSLARASQSVVEELDLQVVQDESGKLEIAVPRALLPDTTRTSVGTAYTRPDGLMRLDTVLQSASTQSFEDLFHQLSTENARRDVTYRTFRDGYFVVSGVLDGEFFYTLMFAEGDHTTGFTLRWSERYQKQGSIVSLFLASFASPWEETALPPISEPGATPSPLLPASDAEVVNRIGNFLVSRETPGVIGLRGDIGPSTPLDFRRAVRAAGDPKVLMLASDGGYVSSALLLAYEVREMGLATYVLPETGCYSACAFVFFAGTERQVDGALGVHQVWGEDTDASAAQTVVSDILEAFADFGVRQEVTSVMLRTLPEDMYVFSSAELHQWGIQSGNPLSLLEAASQVPAEPHIGITVVPETALDQSTERVVPILQGNTLSALLTREGLEEARVFDIEQVFRQSGVDTYLRAGTALKILFGPASEPTSSIAYRVTFHRDGQSGPVTFGVALADNGEYAPMDDGNGRGIVGEGKGPRRTPDTPASYVHLSSQRTEEAARESAEQIIARFGPLFDGADLEVQRVDLGQQGIFYRIRVPASSPAAANLMCERLKAAGGDCFVL